MLSHLPNEGYFITIHISSVTKLLLLLQDQATKDKAMQGLSNMSSAQIVSASAIHNRTNATMFAGTPGIVSSPAPAHTMFSGGQAAAAGGSPVLIKQELAQFTANPQMVKCHAYTLTYGYMLCTYTHAHTHKHTHTHTHTHTHIHTHTHAHTHTHTSLAIQDYSWSLN